MAREADAGRGPPRPYLPGWLRWTAGSAAGVLAGGSIVLWLGALLVLGAVCGATVTWLLLRHRAVPPCPTCRGMPHRPTTTVRAPRPALFRSYPRPALPRQPVPVDRPVPTWAVTRSAARTGRAHPRGGR